ncbi:hypothetical protein JKY72_05825 [Candidatus Gracilibacteria bacterium]|nr:hypothetical protein [Candidatus Gracilibacteria bacterium]
MKTYPKIAGFKEKRLLFINVAGLASSDSEERSKNVLDNSETSSDHSNQMTKLASEEIKPVAAVKKAVESGKELVMTAATSPFRAINTIGKATAGAALAIVGAGTRPVVQAVKNTGQLIANTASAAVAVTLALPRAALDVARLVPRVALVLADYTTQAFGYPLRLIKRFRDKFSKTLNTKATQIDELSTRRANKLLKDAAASNNADQKKAA